MNLINDFPYLKYRRQNFLREIMNEKSHFSMPTCAYVSSLFKSSNEISDIQLL